MAKVPSDKMINTPLQVNFDCCKVENCKVKQNFLTNPNFKGDARMKCSECRKIYKWDKELFTDSADTKVQNVQENLEAEIRILKEIIDSQHLKIKELSHKQLIQKETEPKETEQKTNKKTRGKVVIKRYAKTVEHLRSEGKTIREIAKIVGISSESVLLCIHTKDEDVKTNEK